MRTPFAIALGLALAAGSAHAQDATAALARAEHAYHELQTLRASFVQVLINPMLGAPDTTHGMLYLQPPRRFAMRFSEPKGDRIVVDGTWLWAYTPSTVPDQVIKQPAPQTGATTPNLFAQFVEDPGTRYAATYAGRDTVAGDPVDLVHLVPKVEGLPFREATIAVSTTSGLLRRLDLVETSGQRRRLVLVRLEPNATIPAAEFAFQVPHGVRVVTP
ncbi:MAG TPA: outer membrane lipoprotein carrier protein LolA [Gemmatimonadales bacterium]|nr:outer membrane lipoprotein carrier protein LolA [Gemmatimonadales bacterium]